MEIPYNSIIFTHNCHLFCVFAQWSPAVLAAVTLELSTFSLSPLTRPVNSRRFPVNPTWASTPEPVISHARTAAIEWVTMLAKRQPGLFSWKQMLPRLIAKTNDCVHMYLCLVLECLIKHEYFLLCFNLSKILDSDCIINGVAWFRWAND